MTSLKPEIVIFTGGDMIANQYMNRLVPALVALGVRPVIFITPENSSPKAQTPSLKHYGFYERDIFADVIAPFLNSQEQHGASLTFNQVAAQYECIITTIDNVNDPAVDQAISSANRIGTLSVYNDTIFGDAFIERAKENGFFWNIHHGLLPEQPGVFIPLRAMAAGDKQYGCTLHVVEKRVDSGNIIAQSKRMLTANSVLEAYLGLVENGANLIISAVDEYIRTGTVASTPQDLSKAAYKSFPPEEEIAAAHSKGVSLWGTPHQMLKLIQSLYGVDERLRDNIIQSISDKERPARYKPPVRRVA